MKFELSYLNQEQKQAVINTDGPMIIIAGPGTGKTKTLIAKILYLITEKQIRPENILALTFTKKAAKEIFNRIVDVYSIQPYPHVATFHSLSYEIVAQKIKDIKIISDNDRRKIVREILKDFNEYKGLNIREVELLISNQKIEHVENVFLNVYQQKLAEKNLLDYEDLLIQALNVIGNGQSCQSTITNVINTPQYILVDEFQDTNNIQYDLVKKILGKNKNITIIGDPIQSIYGFRGARELAFDMFKKDFPDAKEIELKINYRSAPNIIKISSKLFPERFQIPHIVNLPGIVQLITTLNEYTQANWIIDKITQIIGGINLNQASDFRGYDEDTKADFRDFAVIYRINDLNRVLEKKLVDNGLPFQVVGGKSIYEKNEVEFIINVLKFLKEKSDQIYLELLDSQIIKIPREIIDRLNSFQKNKNVSVFDLTDKLISQKQIKSKKLRSISNILRSLLQYVVEEQNFISLQNIVEIIIEKFKIQEIFAENESKLRNINEFKSLILRFNKFPLNLALDKFISELSDLEVNDYYDEKANRITLLTMHSAKGLEFKYVFICGFEDGLIPFTRKERCDIEEEKRLFYVAMTRAKQGLFILKTKNKSSRFEPIIKSKELIEIEDPVINKINKKIKKQEEKKSQIKMF